MRRRDLIAAGTLIAATTASGGALASEEKPAAAGGVMNLAPLGLPVIAGGRVRNYVFLQIRLHLGAGHPPESVRPTEPFFRDHLVRAAHRTPFTVAADWTVLNSTAITALLMRAAPTLAGRGVVTRAEIVSQVARRRTGVQPR